MSTRWRGRRRVASMPSMPGMRMSISTTSGACASAPRPPPRRSPPRPRPRCAGRLQHGLEAGAHHRLVVGDDDAQPAHVRRLGVGQRRRAPRSRAPARGLRDERAAEQRGALAHAGEAVAAAAFARRLRAVAVVGDRQLERLGPVRQRDRRVRRAPACLTTLVRASCTIRNADRSRLCGSGARRALDGEVDDAARAARDCSSRSSRSRGRAAARARPSRRRAQQPSVRCISVIAWRPEVGDAVGGLGALRLPHHGRAQRLSLDDHERDVVRHHVVELAGDAHALVRHRLLGEQLALAVEALGALAQRGHLSPARGGVQAKGHGDPVHHGRTEDVAEAHRLTPEGACRTTAPRLASTAAAVIRPVRVEATV